MKKNFAIKLKRIQDYLKETGYAAMLLATRENFAWLTGGGNNEVFWTSDVGFGVLLVTLDDVTLVAHSMDLDRIYDDELLGLGIKKHMIRWHQESREQSALNLVNGACVSDVMIEGAGCKPLDIIRLHYPLMDSEVAQYIENGKAYECIISEIAQRIEPGMTENSVAALAAQKYINAGFRIKTLLIGSDERIGKYRHPNPSDKKIEKLILLHPGVYKDGLNIYATRMVAFGKEIPDSFYKKYEQLNMLEAQAAAMSRPGMQLKDILEKRKAFLADNGGSDEFENHFPGSLVGYTNGTAAPLIENWTIEENMVFGWYITLTGAKVEETVIASPDGGNLITVNGMWPAKRYQYEDYQCELPIVLKR